MILQILKCLHPKRSHDTFADILYEIMALKSLLDDKFTDLPDRSAEIVHQFNKRVTSSCLSFHGNIFGIGYYTGKILVCDSRSFDNKRYFKVHSKEVTSLSFSRDTQFIASGDKNGDFIVHSIITKTIVYQYKFDHPITYIQYSPKALPLILILLDNNSLYLYDQQNSSLVQVPGDFTSATWTNKSVLFFSSTLYLNIKVFNPKGFNEIQSFEPTDEKCRTITSIGLSHNDKFLIILDKSGTGRLLNTETGIICFTFSDRVNNIKYSTAAFDRNDEHVLLASRIYTPQSFVAYNVFTGIITNVFHGLNQPIFHLMFHPLQPVVFARCKDSIYKWATSIRFRMMESVPEDKLMRFNEVYYEREDEFDEISDDENDNESEEVILTPDDLLVNEENYDFSDDYLYPDQIKVLPFEE